jgi:hypothetical protein
VVYVAEWDTTHRDGGLFYFISFVKHTLCACFNCIAISAHRIGKLLKFIFAVSAETPLTGPVETFIVLRKAFLTIS